MKHTNTHASSFVLAEHQAPDSRHSVFPSMCFIIVPKVEITP
jgi:hypothetical protein